MNLAMQHRGGSIKPHRDTSFSVGVSCAQLYLAKTHEFPLELQGFIDSEILLLTIPEKFESDRSDLLKKSKELNNLFQQFKSPSAEQIMELLNIFADQLVDKNKFACTPTMIVDATTSLKLNPTKNLAFWLNLYNNFVSLTSPSGASLDLKTNILTPILGSEEVRRYNLRTKLLAHLTLSEICQLSMLVAEKHMTLEAKPAEVAKEISETAPALTPAYSNAKNLALGEVISTSQQQIDPSLETDKKSQLTPSS